MTAREPYVVALGGNAIARAGDDGSVDSQYLRATEAMREVAQLARAGTPLVVTHGNGPVVGNIVLRGELASGQVPPMPLFIAGADSEGGIGLMLQQALGNELRRIGSGRVVVSLVTQVIVSQSDPAFAHPSKPIGQFYSPEAAQRLSQRHGWTMSQQTDGRWRRVVASPAPVRVVEIDAIRAAVEAQLIPIACGGGGVPVAQASDGTLRGVDAVIDKDWTSALLAEQIGATALVVLMEAEGLFEGWGAASSSLIRNLDVDSAEEMVSDGQVAAGSMAPKLAAAASFVRKTGRDAILTSAANLMAALEHRAGTRIHS